MSIPVKIISGTESGTIKKGNFAFGVSKNRTYGPTSETGFYKGHTIPDGGYVVYLDRGTASPSAYVCGNDSDLISTVNAVSGENYQTVSDAVSWVNTQSGAVAFDKPFNSIVTDGLVLNLDAGNLISYSGTGSTWYDVSGVENNGTLTNGPTFNSNGFLEFDGVDDWISTNYNLIVGTDASRPIVLSFLINPNITQSAVTFNPIIIGSAFYSGFGLQFTGSVYRIYLRITGGTYTNNIPLVPGRFQYVTLIWGGIEDSKTYSYINGVLNSERSIPYDNFNQNLSAYPLRIARAYTSGGDTATGFFAGHIAGLSVYHKNLTPQEILQNYYQAPIVTDGLVFAVDAGNLVSYENGSTTVYNLSGTQSGSLINGVGYSKDKGGIWSFDGVDDYVELEVSPTQITTGDVSISCWINIKSYGDPTRSEVIFRKNGQSNNFYDIVFRISEANKITYACRKSTSTIVGREVIDILDLDKWYHIVACGVNDDINIYINGELKSTTARNNGTTSGETAYIGGTNTASYLDANIANLYLYNKKLSSEEVIQNFEAQRQRFGI
jgi:hypothetical protein